MPLRFDPMRQIAALSWPVPVAQLAYMGVAVFWIAAVASLMLATALVGSVLRVAGCRDAAA
jgi:hypothetical protein